MQRLDYFTNVHEIIESYNNNENNTFKLSHN